MNLDDLIKWTSLASNIVTVFAFVLAVVLAIYEGPSYLKRRKTEKLEKLYELANEFEYAAMAYELGPPGPDYDEADMEEAEKECHQARWALRRYFENNKHSFKSDSDLADIVRTGVNYEYREQSDDLTSHLEKLLQS